MPGLGLDWSVVWAVGLFGLMLFGLVVLVTAKVYRKKVSTGPESMVGGVAEIEEWDGERGRVRIQGEVWHAFSDKPLSLTAGERVLVCKIEGLELKIQTVE